MKYHTLFVVFEKAANFKLSSAANYRLRFMGSVKSRSGHEVLTSQICLLTPLKMEISQKNGIYSMSHSSSQHSISVNDHNLLDQRYVVNKRQWYVLLSLV